MRQFWKTSSASAMAQLPSAANLHLQSNTTLLGILVLIPIAIFFGLVSSLGNPLIVLFLVALMISVVLIASPLTIIWIVVIGGLVLAGLAEVYVPGLRHVRWGVVLAAVGLGCISLLIWGLTSASSNRINRRWQHISLEVWAMLFVLVTLSSVVLNWSGVFNSIVGLKGYFQVWGVFLAFMLLPLTQPQADKLIKALVWFAFLQLPFALHQYFVLVPQRVSFGAGVVPADIVVGTFSGSFTGGGASPSLALLQVMAAAVILGYWRIGKISGLTTLFASISFLVPVILGEAKLVLMLIPVLVGLVFADRVRQRPVVALGAVASLGLLLGFVLFLYTLLPQAGHMRTPTIDEYIEKTIDYNFGPKGHGRLGLNRSTVYGFWLKYHRSHGSMVNSMVGFGPGATNESVESLASHSLAADRYRGYGIGLTALSGLLWETGVIGVLTVVGLLFTAFSRARRLLRLVPQSSEHWVYLKSSQVGIAAIAIMLLHDRMFIFEIGFQTLFVVVLGYLSFMRKTIPDNEAHSAK